MASTGLEAYSTLLNVAELGDCQRTFHGSNFSMEPGGALFDTNDENRITSRSTSLFQERPSPAQPPPFLHDFPTGDAEAHIYGTNFSQHNYNQTVPYYDRVDLLPQDLLERRCHWLPPAHSGFNITLDHHEHGYPMAGRFSNMSSSAHPFHDLQTDSQHNQSSLGSHDHILTQSFLHKPHDRDMSEQNEQPAAPYLDTMRCNVQSPIGSSQHARRPGSLRSGHDQSRHSFDGLLKDDSRLSHANRGHHTVSDAPYGLSHAMMDMQRSCNVTKPQSVASQHTFLQSQYGRHCVPSMRICSPEKRGSGMSIDNEEMAQLTEESTNLSQTLQHSRLASRHNRGKEAIRLQHDSDRAKLDRNADLQQAGSAQNGPATIIPEVLEVTAPLTRRSADRKRKGGTNDYDEYSGSREVIKDAESDLYFPDYNTAKDCFSNVMWKPARENTIPETSKEEHSWVRRRLSAFYATGKSTEKKTKGFMMRWMADDPRRPFFDPAAVERQMWMILHLAMKIHTRGFSLPMFYDPSKGRDHGKDYTFEERLEAICTLFEISKTSCESIMKGDRILQIVTAPAAITARSLGNSRLNGNRSIYIKAGRGLAVGQNPQIRFRAMPVTAVARQQQEDKDQDEDESERPRKRARKSAPRRSKRIKCTRAKKDWESEVEETDIE